MSVTEKTIDELLAATFIKHTDPREKHFFRESLRNLVRLAKAEQLQEMRLDLMKSTPAVKRTTPIFVAPQ